MTVQWAFTIVLGGGGARGFAHAGVLRALEREGLVPSAIVGVSMGAVVGATFAHRADWYDALLAMDLSAFPGPADAGRGEVRERFSAARRAVSYLRVATEMVTAWGPGTTAREAGLAELRRLLDDASLEDGRIPVAVAASDLASGRRVVLRSGPAVRAVYASAALAGVLPPLEWNGQLLADGAYTDLAPVDVARSLGQGPVVAVDPGQPTRAREIHNGFQAIMRAMEICHRRHADLRFDEADLVLRPRFRRSVDTLDFAARRECVAAGIREVRRKRAAICGVLDPASVADGQVKSEAGTT